MKLTFTIRLFFFLLLTSIAWEASAQPGSTNPDRMRTQIWYFGQNAGLDFSTEPPIVLMDGAMNTGEGCATICDTAGNLLFYTNGEKVWNRFHQLMPNGSGLNGHNSAAQGTLIVPYPGRPELYYIFTTDAIGQSKGLQYSVVDMSLAMDSGNVTLEKNVSLITPVSEKVAAIKHANGKDVWMVSRGYNDMFYAYLITEAGLVNCPVITKISLSASGPADAQGCMHFSSDGQWLVNTNYLQAQVDFYHFDREKGVFSELQSLAVQYPYGVEFSPDNRYCYIATRLNKLYQCKLEPYDFDSISASLVKLYEYSTTIDNVTRTLQFMNGKIYMAIPDSNFLGVINHPDSAGMSCDFIFDGYSLGLVKSQYGLPNYITSYFYTPAVDFRYELTCTQDSGHFYGLDTNTVNNWSWKVRQVSSGTTSTYTTQDMIHVFADTGRYEVQLIAMHGGGSDTVIKIIVVTKPQPLNLGPNKTICEGDSLVLQVGSQFRCYTWEDNSQVDRRVLKSTGTYFIQTVNEHFCIEYDTITLTIQPLPAKPTITRSKDTLFSSEAHSYQWYRNGSGLTSATNGFLKLTQNGSFQVAIADSIGCTNISDPIQINDLSVKTPAGQLVNIYPNPASQTVNVEIPAIVHFQQVQFFTLLGQPVEVAVLVQNHLVSADVHALPVGMYVLRIDLENEVVYHKVLIQRI